MPMFAEKCFLKFSFSFLLFYNGADKKKSIPLKDT